MSAPRNVEQKKAVAEQSRRRFIHLCVVVVALLLLYVPVAIGMRSQRQRQAVWHFSDGYVLINGRLFGPGLDMIVSDGVVRLDGELLYAAPHPKRRYTGPFGLELTNADRLASVSGVPSEDRLARLESLLASKPDVTTVTRSAPDELAVTYSRPMGMRGLSSQRIKLVASDFETKEAGQKLEVWKQYITPVLDQGGILVLSSGKLATIVPGGGATQIALANIVAYRNLDASVPDVALAGVPELLEHRAEVRDRDVPLARNLAWIAPFFAAMLWAILDSEPRAKARLMSRKWAPGSLLAGVWLLTVATLCAWPDLRLRDSSISVGILTVACLISVPLIDAFVMALWRQGFAQRRQS